MLDTLSQLITILSRGLIVFLSRLVMLHRVLAIFLTAAYFSHRSSIFVHWFRTEPGLKISIPNVNLMTRLP